MIEHHVPQLPRAPHLVADAPVLHPERLGGAVFDAPAAPQGLRRPVAVLELRGGGVGVAKPRVHRDPGLGLDQPAEAHELVHAEIVVLDAGPGRIRARRTAIAVADAVAPVVAADEIAARPAVDRGSQVLQQSEGVGTQAFDVVRGHQGDRSDERHAFLDQKLEGRLVGGPFSREAEWEALVVGGSGSQGDGSLGRRVVPPRERDIDGHVLAAVAFEPDIARIALALGHPEVLLADAGAGLDARRVPPDKRLVPAHGKTLGRADDPPRRSADDGEGRFAQRPVRAIVGGDGVVELPVFEHLGPNAAVDAASEMLDELAVDVQRHRFLHLAGLDGDARRRRLPPTQLRQFNVVVPRLAGRLAPAAQQAVDLQRGLILDVELDLDPRPIGRPGQGFGGGALEVRAR